MEPGAQLGVDCEIQAYAIISRHVQLGDRVVVYPHAYIGGDPQYLKFDRSLSTGVKVGAGTIFREYATVNRSIHGGKSTTVGENCFFMAGSHVGHDCEVGNHVVLANNALLAGHVSIGDYTFFGGGAAIHQFSRVGPGAMVSGLARITRDVPPFLLVAERDDVTGFNLVGLKRRGVTREAIRELKEAYRQVYYLSGNIREIAARALNSGDFVSSEARLFLDFFSEGKRGFVRPGRGPTAASTDHDS